MAAATHGPAARDTLVRLLGPLVERDGLDLEDVEITPAGKRRLVRVVVDGDGGVSLDGIAAVSQSVSALLDDSPEADGALGGNPYVLEVTSPGVDRPLTEPRHWRRAAGRLVAVTLDGGEQVTGRILSSTPDVVTVQTGQGERVVALSDVSRARVEVEFSRPDEPEPSRPDERAED